MDPIQTRSERSKADLSVVSELLSGSYDVRRALGKSRAYLRYETETEGKRATVLLLPVDCEARPDDAVALDARLRELRTLDHPGTAPVLRHGTRHGIPFVEHPPYAGRTLSEQLEQGPVGRERALAITLEILEALSYAHSRGLCHGALTPADVVIVRDSYEEERAVVFGIGLTSVVREFGGRKTGMTERDPYAAPELLDGAPPSGRADVYSVGALLYRMITDEVPPPPPIVSAFAGNPLLPPDLEPLLIRALAPQLVDRYPSVDEMMLEVLDALNARRALSSRPPRRDRRSSVIVAKPKAKKLPWAIGATLLIGGLAAMAFALSGPADVQPPGIVSAEPTAVAPAAETAPAAAPAAPAVPDAPAASAEPSIVDPVVLDAPVDPVVLDAPVDPAVLDAPADEVALDDAPTVDLGDESRDLGMREVALDPLSGELTPDLEHAATRLLDGQSLSRAELAPLYRHSTRHPEDPRANLLLGDAFVERGWYSDAIERYYAAHSADGASRHHQVMLENLVWLTFKERHVADFAADAIADIYGAEATNAVAAALASDPDGPGQRERLERLYTRITR